MSDLSCRACGSTNIKDFPHDIHGTGVKCGDCGRFIKWMGKGNRKNRRHKNTDYRHKWKAQGPLKCHWCGIVEGETAAHFEIDHILPLEDGGEDVFENTRPLCAACHWSRNAELHRMKFLRRLNKRTEMYKGYLNELRGEKE